MSLRASLIKHNGSEIYLVDYSNIRSVEEFHSIITETGKFREGLINNGKLGLPLLVDITNSHLNLEIFDLLKKHGLLTKKIIIKEAIVGLTKFRFLVQVFNIFSGMNFKIFSNKEEALSWLTENNN